MKGVCSAIEQLPWKCTTEIQWKFAIKKNTAVRRLTKRDLTMALDAFIFLSSQADFGTNHRDVIDAMFHLG